MAGSQAVTGVRGLASKTVRRSLNWGAQQLPVRRRLDQLASRITLLLDRTAPDGMYGGSYFGDGRDPQDRMGLSGYSTYDRVSSMANRAAFIEWAIFPGSRSLDVTGICR
jgi:hypothetical protein